MPSRRRRSGTLNLYLETLESRSLLSGVVPSFIPLSALSSHGPAQLAPSTIAPLGMVGLPIYAQSGQSFRAVVGIIRLEALPTGYHLKGLINWGDGTPSSDAVFVRQPNGAIDVLGAHTYAAPGIDVITVQVAVVPPIGTLPPIRLLGMIRTKAQVALPNGGVTLNETVKVPFTDNVGVFRTSAPVADLTAIINWGDGTQSVGKIVALPTADPIGGAYAVIGEHTYSSLGSYHLHISIISSRPTPVASTAVNLVASFDSVIDVLPVLPTDKV